MKEVKEMKKFEKLTVTLLGALMLTSCGTNQVNARQGQTNATTFALTDILLMENKAESTIKMVKKLNQESNNDELNNVLSILKQVDTLLNENRKSFTSKIEIINDGTYETKETITYIDQNNTQKTVELFYNTQYLEEKYEEEIEAITINKGYLLTDGRQYNFISEKEIEEEKNEIEKSNKIKVETGLNSFIECEQSYEEETENNVIKKEEKYEYKIVENNKTINEYSISFETGKNNLSEIELEIDNVEYEIKEFSKNNKTYLSLEVEKDDGEKEFIYEISLNENGEKSYTLIQTIEE